MQSSTRAVPPGFKSRLPALLEFAAAIDPLLERDSSFEAFRQVEPHLKKLVSAPLLRAVVNEALAHQAEQQTVRHTLSGNRACYNVYATGNFILALACYEPNGIVPPQLVEPAEHRMVACFGPNALTYEEYAVAPERRNDVFDQRHALTGPAVHELAPGECRAFRAGASFYRKSPATKPAIALLVLSPQILRYQWHYDASTLAPVKFCASSISEVRLGYALQILRNLDGYDRDESIAPLEGLLAHPSHEIRWETTKTLIELDPDRAEEFLRGRLDDEHPFLRNAARRTLEAYDLVEA